MLVQQALYRLVTGNAGVAAVIEDRMHFGFLSQTVEEPAIAYRAKKEGSDYVSKPKANPGQTGGAVSGPAEYRFAFFCTVKGKRDSKSAPQQAALLAALLQMAIDGFQGTVDDGASPASEMYIQGIFHESTEHLYDDPTQTHQFLSVYQVTTNDERPS